MKRTIIRKERVNRPNTKEPKRTRWLIHVICNKCKTHFSILNNVDTNKYCRNCEVALAAAKRWDKKMKEKYADKYSYDLSTFKTANDLIKVFCKYHGEFTVKPVHIASKARSSTVGACPGCAKDFQKIKNNVSTEEWKQRIIDKVGDTVTIETEKPFLRTTDKVTATCKIHGQFSLTVSGINKNILVCPNCGKDANSYNVRWHREDIPGTLYLAYFPKISLWKLGVTHRSMWERRRELGGKAYCKIVWLYKTSTLKEAYLLEHLLFKKYTDKRYSGERILPYGGYTELLTTPIPKLTRGFVKEILHLNEPKRGTSNQIML